MRIRVRFDEHGKIRFLSHRDVARAWERALRRAGVAVAYTEGFSPRPKLSFGLALSTGYESHGEYLDIELRAGTAIGPEDLPGLVSPMLPEGMSVQAAVALETGAQSLQQAVTSCSWRIEVLGQDGAPPPAREALAEAVDRALGATGLPVEIERKGTRAVHDLRPGVIRLEVAEPDPGERGVNRLRSGHVLEAELATQPRSVRPSELLRALDPTWVEGVVTRTHQWTSVDGARREPIALTGVAAASTPHAGARA